MKTPIKIIARKYVNLQTHTYDNMNNKNANLNSQNITIFILTLKAIN